MTKASEWGAHVSGWRGSGQTAAAYCAEEGLNVASLRYWSSRVREQERAAPVKEPERGTVRLAQVRTKASDRSGGSGALSLSVGELTLQVPASFDRDALREALSLVLDVVEGRR